VAENLHSTCVPDKRVNCCTAGGEKTKLGAFDIEDLVSFGVQPNITKGVALYRDPNSGTSSFGIVLGQDKNNKYGNVTVREIKSGGAAAVEGSLKVDDLLVAVNGIDVASGKELKTVTATIKQSQDPLLLDVYRGNHEDIDVDEYSSESACPYYLSRALAKRADITFCPYNYVLDPDIRNAMEIDVDGAIIVLDEAHNVEDTLRSVGSGQFKEFELIEMIALLNSHAMKYVPSSDKDDDDKELHEKMPVAAHCLLILIESVVKYLRKSKTRFEKNEGANGVTKATNEYQKFKCPDNKEWEVSYFGPFGNGSGGKPVGCHNFFREINFENPCTNTHSSKQHQTSCVDTYTSQVEIFETFISSSRREASQQNSTLADRIVTFMNTICNAYRLSEHYYISSVVSANGNLDFATGNEDQINAYGQVNRFRKKPKSIVQNPRPIEQDQLVSNRICNLKSCNIGVNRGCVSHDELCDGSMPQWEASLIINLLTPAVLMGQLTKRCRSVVLASGSLAPISSLCAELNLLPPSPDAPPIEVMSNPMPSSNSDSEAEKGKEKTDIFIDPFEEKFGRLQVVPKPLEASHVINLEKQLLAVSIGHFPDGSPLSVKMSSYSKAGFHDKLGDAISGIIESIPHGGILVFFPSFSFLRKCESTWRNNSTWERLLRAKGEVVVEPSGSSQSKFEEERDRFNETIRTTGNCILLAVFRGKMSEGVSFNDDYARGVICVGVPFPNMYDRSISAKMSYNNEQRRFRKRTVLAGNEWYSQQAYRAIAQAIGRCIRHAADYGTIILLDSRHCDDGSPLYENGVCQAHAKLPRWMRSNVKTLRSSMQSFTSNEILNGWRGLKMEMKSFFPTAKAHSAAVQMKHMQDFQKSQNSTGTKNLIFNSQTGNWSQSPTIKNGNSPQSITPSQSTLF